MENILKELLPPFICEDKETYVNNLEIRLQKYREFLYNELQGRLMDVDYQTVDIINESIITAIKAYLKGKSGKAFNKIKEVLSCPSLSHRKMTYNLNNSNAFIRMRKSNVPLYKKENLFHIPFSQRHKVSKQRYSIDGLPCLYIAGCSYVAWLELGRPNFNELWASAFRPTKEIYVFDLCYNLECVNELFNKEMKLTEKSKTQLLFYPFVIATSYRTKYPFSPFHEEYIISNILLQWVMENEECAGIRYLSTKLEAFDKDKLWMTSNIVLPPKRKNEDFDYDDDLCQDFEMTKPQQCFVLEAYSNAGGVTALDISGGMDELSEKGDDNLNHIDIAVLKNYNVTRFYNIDGYLRKKLKYSLLKNR